MINKTDFELKNLKYFDGTDGLCFSMTVYIKGKKAFTAQNDGRGGDNLYTPYNSPDGLSLLEQAHAFAESLPPYVIEDWNISGDMDLDILLEELMQEKQEKAFFKKKCKTNTLFKLPDAKKGEYLIINRLYSEGMRAYVLGKHPNAIIINEELNRELRAGN